MSESTESSAGRAKLLSLFDAAVSAAHPDACLPAHLPALPAEARLIIVGAGKASAAMAAAAERHYTALGCLDRVEGFTTAPYGTIEALASGLPRVLRVMSARHPTPDARSVEAAERTLAIVATATAADLVLVLLSGGASALWAAPVTGLNIEAKITLTRGLLKSGADIYEMNTVRRHLSRIKGGRLRKATPASMLTLAISDVPGDDPATIGSGPTVADASTLDDARAVLARRAPRMQALGLDIPSVVSSILADPANETPKPNDPAFATAEYRIIATPAASLAAAAARCKAWGYEVVNLGDAVTGEAREVAQAHATSALEAKAAGRKVAILSGGELEVTVRNAKGRGGRSQEYALAFALAIAAQKGIMALAADTDGIDGGDGSPRDPAGAVVDGWTAEGVRHGDALKSLDNNDATTFFEAAGGLIVRGPTHTNVNDFRAILVDP